MLDLTTVMVYSENPQPLVEFYKKVLEKDPEWSEGGYSGFKVGNMILMFGPHSEVHGKNTMPARFIINFETSDVEKEFERIEKLGATVVAKPYHPGEDPKMSLATFADPEGNYFQLASPMKM